MYFPDGTEQSGYAWEFEYRREMDGSFLPFNIHKNGGICHGIPVRALYTVKILKLYPDVYRRITGRNCGRCENNNSSDGGADLLERLSGRRAGGVFWTQAFRKEYPYGICRYYDGSHCAFCRDDCDYGF